MPSFLEANVKRKRVLLRLDLDVPMKDGQIVDDFRIISSLPTIEYLIKNRAAVIVIGHLGRPEGQYIAHLSLGPIARRLAELLPGVPISFADSILSLEVRRKISNLNPGEIFILGNIRFLKEESLDNEHFASELAQFADLYINDAFAVCHRAQTSVHAITKFLPSFSGLSLEAEWEHLSKLMLSEPERPYTAVVGGAKTSTKLPVLQALIAKVDYLLLGGALANTFLKAGEVQISQSVFEPNQLVIAESLLSQNPGKISIPQDWLTDDLLDGNFRIMDIGPETIKEYQEIIAKSATIFWNGNLGVSEKEEFASGTREIARSISQNQAAYTIVAGGDTIAAIRQNHLEQGFDFISTGGGATLALLAGERLPGLTALGIQN